MPVAAIGPLKRTESTAIGAFDLTSVLDLVRASTPRTGGWSKGNHALADDRHQCASRGVGVTLAGDR
jgi:hypothetical protein